MRMRLIDAEPLKELFPDNGEGSWTYNATVKAYIDAQPTVQPETNCSEIPNNCPAADVVSVVRCKDCKFRENDDFCTGRGFPYQLVPDDGFCDKGRKERR